MGLDMYLHATKYLSKYDNEPLAKELREKFKVPPSGNLESVRVKFEIAYWRKANQIHKWFIDNCANGEDEGQNVYVSRKDLQKLLATIKEALADMKLAKTNLPTQPGFFFGPTEYDDYYWQDLKETKTKLEEILSNKDLEGFEFEYRASW